MVGSIGRTFVIVRVNMTSHSSRGLLEKKDSADNVG